MKILNENQTRRKATCDAPYNSGTRLHSGAPHKTAARVLAALLLTVLLAGLVAGCSVGRKDDGKIRIVTTIFPEYDWVREVLGDNPAGAELTLLTESGVDMHSYQPAASDILTIAGCDLFIYVGGESDAWAANALKQRKNDNRLVINLMETLGSDAREEELVEGMEDACDTDASDTEGDPGNTGRDTGATPADNRHSHVDTPEYDEHVWLSLRNAARFVTKISEALQTLDPAHAEDYKKNAEAYLAKLSALDEQYKKTVEAAPVKTLLFGDRFPFRYLTEDYGLTYYAAFVGCSAETEASFATITFLAGKLDELALPAVLTIEGSDGKLAQTVSKTAKPDPARQILSLNSLQSVTKADIDAGATYLGIMTDNLDVLRVALGL